MYRQKLSVIDERLQLFVYHHLARYYEVTQPFLEIKLAGQVHRLLATWCITTTTNPNLVHERSLHASVVLYTRVKPLTALRLPH